MTTQDKIKELRELRTDSEFTDWNSGVLKIARNGSTLTIDTFDMDSTFIVKSVNSWNTLLDCLDLAVNKIQKISQDDGGWAGISAADTDAEIESKMKEL